MFKLGLCSVTFRQLAVEQVITLAHETGLQGIEWGGDIHVPVGDIKLAERTAALTRQADLEIVSYGSYYRLGERDESFNKVLETAVHLQAPAIRVWAGAKGSVEAGHQDREKVNNDARKIADMAKTYDIAINIEYHGGTLTDTIGSAQQLMTDIDHPNVFLYWQPAVGETVKNRVHSISTLYKWLSHVHVFHWRERERFPFDDPFSHLLSF